MWWVCVCGGSLCDNSLFVVSLCLVSFCVCGKSVCYRSVCVYKRYYHCNISWWFFDCVSPW